MRYKIIKFFLLVSLGLYLTNCKKYPENTIWFKNPANIAFIQGKMTHWIVNGVDSIDFLDNYFGFDYNNQPYSTDFSNLTFSSDGKKGNYEFITEQPSDYQGDGSKLLMGRYSYKNKGKSLQITTSKDANYQKKIFVSDDILWDIIYLSKKDSGKRKLKGSYNGNIYEIQFN